MNEATLRRWARGQLSDVEERQLYTWMVRSTDRRLPLLVQGVLREVADEEADAALRQRGGLWARLARSFDELRSLDLAEWTAPGAGFVPASADLEVTPMTLVETDDGSAVRLTVAADEEVVVFLTTDAPSLVRLWGPASSPPDSLTLPELSGRPTLWAFVGPSLPRRPSPELELGACLDQPTLSRQALRWEG